METFIIRKAQDTDIPVLCLLMEQLSGKPISQEDMRNRLHMTESSSTDTIFVYEEEVDVQAALVFRIRENIREVSRYGEIGIIVVKSSAKRRGIGRRLIGAGPDGNIPEARKPESASGFGRSRI